jgi:hypothetical protein
VLLCETAPPVPINGTEPAVNPDIVNLEVVALVAFSLVIVPEAEVRSEMVVVARVDLPVTTKVLVVVLLVVVKLSISATVAESRFEKKLVEVALSKNAKVP